MEQRYKFMNLQGFFVVVVLFVFFFFVFFFCFFFFFFVDFVLFSFKKSYRISYKTTNPKTLYPTKPQQEQLPPPQERNLLCFLVLDCVGCLLLVLFFRTGFLCSSGCPGTHFVDQAGLECRALPASAS